MVNTEAVAFGKREEVQMSTVNKPKIRLGERPAEKYAAYAADAWKSEGEEALKAIADSQHELGKKYARMQIRSRGIMNNDAKAAGEVYETLLQELSVEHSIIENTGKRFIVQTKGCPFLQEWKDVAEEDVQKLCEGFGNSFVQGLCEEVNPKIRYHIIRMMSRGEPYCEERIELGK